MLKKYLLIAASVFLQSVSHFAQTPPFYHYTSKDGLASSTVFHAIQDKNGFLWFATLNGLSKFDGKQFTTFKEKDGLNSDVITHLLEADDGKIYIANFEKGINVLHDGKIRNYYGEKEGVNFSTSYLVSFNKKIYAYHLKSGIIILSENGSSTVTAKFYYPSPIFINRLEKLPNGKLAVLTEKGIFDFENDVLTKINMKGLADNNLYCLASDNEGNYFIGGRGTIYKIKNDCVIKKYNVSDNSEVNQVFIDKNNNIWFALRSKGAFVIPRGSDKVINIGAKLDIGNTQVDNYLEDTEGNIWISTYGKGVFCLNNLYLANYDESDGLDNNNIHSILKDISGKILIGTFKGINIFENEKVWHLKDQYGKLLSNDIYSIKNFDNKLYICMAGGTNRRVKTFYKDLNFFLINTRSFLKTGDGLYLSGGWGNSIIVEKSLPEITKEYSRIYVFGDESKVNRVNELFEDTGKNIWAGTAQGLCKFTFNPDNPDIKKWQKAFFTKDTVLNGRINAIYQDRQNKVWFAGVNGIANYNLENNSVTSYTSISGYDLSGATSISSDNKNRIWVGTMTGLYLLDGNTIKYLNSQTGLPSDEVLSLCFDSEKNLLYTGTNNGLSILDVNSFDHYKYPPLSVKINNINAGDSIYTNYKNLVFESWQNNVYLNFSAISFTSPETVKYKYKLNDKWMETGYSFLNLISLQNGTYELLIMAKSQNSEWGKPFFLTFYIKSRFYETILFKLGIISLLIFASMSVVIWNMKRKTKKISEQLELTERINELKHQALSAMMNPHFIFNSLNSVQYLVNCKKYEEANEYIAMMAKLMRKNLDTAGNGFILLSEEINKLKLYLDLEKLRFLESFSYEIITGGGIKTDLVMIPNMIIQPFVENSLWHGILDSGKKGILTIFFSFEDIEIDSITSRVLIIKVTDNGIGIKEAKKNKKDDHISKGIQIIEERLKLLSEKAELPKPIIFEDLSSHKNNSQGTEVIISLPPPLYKVIIPPADFF